LSGEFVLSFSQVSLKLLVLGVLFIEWPIVAQEGMARVVLIGERLRIRQIGPGYRTPTWLAFGMLR